MRGGGSSRVFRRACAVGSVIRSASSRTKTLPAALERRQRRPALELADLLDADPRRALRVVAGGVGASRWQSGCCPAATRRQSAHVPQPRAGQRQAWANPRAVSRRPTPDGPDEGVGVGDAVGREARWSSATAAGWPRCRPRHRRHSGVTAARRPSRAGDGAAIAAATSGLGAGRVDQLDPRGLPLVERPDTPCGPARGTRSPSCSKGSRLPRAPAGARAAEPLDHVEVQHQREVGHEAVRRQPVQLGDDLERDAAPVSLVGDRGVGVAVAEDDRPRSRAGRMTRRTCSARPWRRGEHSVSGIEAGRPRRAPGGRHAPRGEPSGSDVATTDTPRPASQAARRLDLRGLACPLDALDRDQAIPPASGRARRHVPGRLTHGPAASARGRHAVDREDEPLELADLALGELARRADRLGGQDGRRRSHRVARPRRCAPRRAHERRRAADRAARPRSGSPTPPSRRGRRSPGRTRRRQGPPGAARSATIRRTASAKPSTLKRQVGERIGPVAVDPELGHHDVGAERSDAAAGRPRRTPRGRPRRRCGDGAARSPRSPRPPRSPISSTKPVPGKRRSPRSWVEMVRTSGLS